MKSLRRKVLLGGLCLLVLWFAELARLPAAQVKHELGLITRSPSLATEEVRLRGAGFAFDPQYGVFLTAVRDLTPVDSTIAILFPAHNELYFYEASYTLAPRRLVRFEERPIAQFTALYSTEEVAPPPNAQRITHGFLLKQSR